MTRRLKLSFQSRIALAYILSTALLLALIMLVVFVLVKRKVMESRNALLNESAQYYSQRIRIGSDGLVICPDSTPLPSTLNNVFVEITDLHGYSLYRSGNLGGDSLYYENGLKDRGIVEVQGIDMRYMKAPLLVQGIPRGYVYTWIAISEAEEVSHRLRKVMLLLYAVALLVLFAVARLVVKKSIKPIRDVIQTANHITHRNLSTRIPLPPHKDELFELSSTLNRFLQRMEQAVERERSFTSYASHELRTPLAVIKGTLEVLVRKPRTEQEYQHKIGLCLAEVDRMNSLVDGLLLLARYESLQQVVHPSALWLEDALMASLGTFAEDIQCKQLLVDMHCEPSLQLHTDEHLLTVILSNLISNAVKYAWERATIQVCAYSVAEGGFCCEITNQGPQIPEGELQAVFDKFYRVQASQQARRHGFGLGLALVQQCCGLLGFDISLQNLPPDRVQLRLRGNL